MGASPGQQITWQDTREVAKRIDELAASLGTPDYKPLLEDMTTPFPLDELPSAEITIEFEISDPSTMTDEGEAPEISQQRLMTGTEGGATALRLEEPLSKLSDSGDLYFLHKEDECWCKTLFKINSGPFYYLTEVEDPEWKCSCQTIKVPDWPERLDYGQKVIPAAFATDWYQIGYNGDSETGSPDWLTSKRCEEDGGKLCHYGIKPMAEGPNGRSGFMFLAQREMKGLYTWPIRAKWFDAMKERVDYILDCLNNCGVKKGSVVKAGSGADGEDPVYIPEHCPASWCDIAWTMGLSLTGSPGCLTDECKLPWHEKTCEGENCDDTPKLYAHTLDQLTDMMNNIEEWVYPFSEKCDPTDPEWETTGSATVESPQEGEWQRVRLCMEEVYTPPASTEEVIHHHPLHHGETPCDGSASTKFCPRSFTNLNIVAEGYIEAVRSGLDKFHIRVFYVDENGEEQTLLDDEKSSTGSVTPDEDHCDAYNYDDLTGDSALVYDVGLPGDGQNCQEVYIDISFDTIDDAYNCGVGYIVSFSLS